MPQNPETKKNAKYQPNPLVLTVAPGRATDGGEGISRAGVAVVLIYDWPDDLGKIEWLRDGKLPGSTFQVSQTGQQCRWKYVVFVMTKVMDRKKRF